MALGPWTNYRDRGFYVNGPATWNSILPAALRTRDISLDKHFSLTLSADTTFAALAK